MWFYKNKVIEGSDDDVYDNTTSQSSTSNVKKIHYHNSKCKCGYQVVGVPPDEIESTVDCFEPMHGFKSSSQFNGLKVSYDETSVQVATEVYNGGK